MGHNQSRVSPAQCSEGRPSRKPTRQSDPGPRAIRSSIVGSDHASAEAAAAAAAAPVVRPLPPPAAAVRAAECRGDVVHFRDTSDRDVMVCVCKWRQIEVFIDRVWARRLESVQLAEPDSDTVELCEDDIVVVRVPREEIERSVSTVQRICNRASIPHDLELSGPAPRCRHCGERRTRDFTGTVCLMWGRLHHDEDFDHNSEREFDSWTDATVLPPGAVQAAVSPTASARSSPTPSYSWSSNGENQQQTWECQACMYNNKPKRSLPAKTCRLCGADRPTALSSALAARSPMESDLCLSRCASSSSMQSAQACLCCGKSLKHAPPFCSATGRPHHHGRDAITPRSIPSNRLAAQQKPSQSTFETSSASSLSRTGSSNSLTKPLRVTTSCASSPKAVADRPEPLTTPRGGPCLQCLSWS
ncbi:hypothetical protein DIPPA_28907 [Diplonema papillatum]|nr:hypothetical protein DIPPA_28907 [Diplonema papillatum]